MEHFVRVFTHYDFALEMFVQLFEAGCDVYRIADDREFLPLFLADVAADETAEMDAASQMPRSSVSAPDCGGLSEYLQGCIKRRLSGVWKGIRHSEHSEQSVTRKFVDESAIGADDRNDRFEEFIEFRDDFRSFSRLRISGKPSYIEEKYHAVVSFSSQFPMARTTK